MKICIPVPATSNSAALKMMEEIYPKADIMELRIDRIRNPDVPQLVAARKKEIIVTNRRGDEGGSFRGTEVERVGLLKQAVRFGAEYVDIEMRTDRSLITELLSEIRKQGRFTEAIISYHDFSGTPDPAGLDWILRKCAVYNGIIKIATMANEPEDNLRILALIAAAKKTNKRIIAFCMGEKGRLSRIAAPLLGSYLSYASLKKGAESAPGQLTVDEMRGIMKVLANG